MPSWQGVNTGTRSAESDSAWVSKPRPNATASWSIEQERLCWSTAQAYEAENLFGLSTVLIVGAIGRKR